MRAIVTCTLCEQILGDFEKESPITGNDIELSREFAVCHFCGSADKRLEIVDSTLPDPTPPEPALEENPQEPPPPASDPWWKFW